MSKLPLSRRKLLCGATALASGICSFAKANEIVLEPPGSIQQRIDELRARGAPGSNDEILGGDVVLAPGVYEISRPLVLRMGVSLVGAGRMATRIVASRDYPEGQPLLKWADEKEIVFGSRILNLELHGRDRCPIGIESTEAQEGCTIENVRIRSCLQKGVFLHRSGSPTPGNVRSAAEIVISNVEIWMSNRAESAIHIQDCSGSFSIRDVTALCLDGGSRRALDQSAGIAIEHSVASIDHYHWESFSKGLRMFSGAAVGAVNIYGGNAPEGGLAVEIEAGSKFSGRLLQNVDRWGATLVDGNSNQRRTGMISQYSTT